MVTTNGGPLDGLNSSLLGGLLGSTGGLGSLVSSLVSTVGNLLNSRCSVAQAVAYLCNQILFTTVPKLPGKLACLHTVVPVHKTGTSFSGTLSTILAAASI